MQTRLSRFVVLSLLAHAAIIAGLRSMPDFSAMTGATLDVTLLPPNLAARAGARPQPQPPPGAPRTPSLPASLQPSGNRIAIAGPRDTVSGPQTAGTSATREPATLSRDASRQDDASGSQLQSSVPAQATGERLRQLVLQALAPYFHYPLLARQEGWEGRVLLRLRVGPDGRLGDIRLEKSSGYALLDEAALRSLGHVGRLPDAAIVLRGGTFDLLVPIVYRLSES